MRVCVPAVRQLLCAGCVSCARTVDELPREDGGLVLVRGAGDGVDPGQDVRDEPPEPRLAQAGLEEVFPPVERPALARVSRPLHVRDGAACFFVSGGVWRETVGGGCGGGGEGRGSIRDGTFVSKAQ